ncbi:ABC-F family ATP-binding cassette domain-containing protein [Paenibacillus thailandensis]|uniref:ABC-F family ATP-binding cassette domain-containing protein n=1 Tax=Paenibacillus thailandensis TaxID=393250 RepID=A0ABW5QW49_9BACL
MSIVTMNDITHGFTDKTIFRNVKLRLNRGEHAGLVGSNGTGKSTLLRMLSGTLLPDAGSIDWLPGIRIGYLRQHAELRAGSTVRQNLQEAFAPLYEAERRIQEIAEQLREPAGNGEKLLHRLGELQNRLEVSGFYELDAKVEEVAAGLGLTAIGLERDVGRLSGGQRTKLLLGRLLLEQPDVLLLDEPTNYLDEAHIEWLIAYLKRYENAYVVVSHDERFLNEVTSIIFHLEHQQLKRYAGNYTAFRTLYEQSKRQAEAAYERQRQEIGRLESFIQKNRIRKAKQAKSREKALERMEKIERPLPAAKPRFAFSVCSEPVPKVMEAKGIQIGYSAPLFAPRDLLVRRGDKIAVVGSNGIGKTTVLRTLLKLVQPLSGTVRIGERVQVGYYAQEDGFTGRTPLELVAELRPDLSLKEIRKTLAIAGLKEQHIRRPVRTLSGGEQAKVRLAGLMLSRCNVLVLDEPTNHLDVPAKEALAAALSDYGGTVVLVSHEPEFYKEWATDIWEVEKWK